MTDEQTANQIAALKRERRGYVQRLQRAEKHENAEEAERLTKRIGDVDGTLAKLEASDDHVCDECGFEAKSAGGLKSHKRSHEE